MTQISCGLQAQTCRNDEGEVVAERIRDLSKDDIHNMLKNGPIEFVVAPFAYSIQWIPIKDCYKLWKSGAKQHISDDQNIHVGDDYCYVASEWKGISQVPIVLLQMHH